MNLSRSTSAWIKIYLTWDGWKNIGVWALLIPELSGMDIIIFKEFHVPGELVELSFQYDFPTDLSVDLNDLLVGFECSCPPDHTEAPAGAVLCHFLHYK